MLQNLIELMQTKRSHALTPSADLHLCHTVLLQWLLLISLLIYATYIASQYNVFSLLLEHDPTYISSLILITFLVSSSYCGYQAIYLSHEINLGLKLIDALLSGDRVTAISHQGIVSEYRNHHGHSEIPSLTSINSESLSALLEQKTSRHHEAAWFTVNLLLKLGLLGTVVGFILMINALTEVKTIEYSDIKDLISNMALGMGIALTTTVVGLVTSILLGVQCLFLDRAANFILCLAPQSILARGQAGAT